MGLRKATGDRSRSYIGERETAAQARRVSERFGSVPRLLTRRACAAELRTPIRKVVKNNFRIFVGDVLASPSDASDDAGSVVYENTRLRNQEVYSSQRSLSRLAKAIACSLSARRAR